MINLFQNYRLALILPKLFQCKSWSDYQTVQKTYPRETYELIEEGLIQVDPDNDTCQIKYNYMKIRIIGLHAHFHVPHNIPAISGTETSNDKMIQYKNFVDALDWLWKRKPLSIYIPESNIEKLAACIAEKFNAMAQFRQECLEPVYNYPYNPRRSPYWVDFIKTAVLCNENQLDYEDFLLGQFMTVKPKWCLKISGTRVPPPNYMHSAGSLKRYQYYLDHYKAKGNLNKTPFTFEQWFRFILTGGLNHATAVFFNQLETNNGALVLTKETPEDTRQFQVESAFKSTYSIALLSLANWRYKIDRTWLESHYTENGCRYLILMLRYTFGKNSDNLSICRQIYYELRRKYREYYQHHPVQRKYALLSLMTISQYLTGQTLTIPVALPQTLKAQNMLKLKQIDKDNLKKRGLGSWL